MRESSSVGPRLDRGIEVEVKVLNLLYPCEYFGSNSSQENRLSNRRTPVAFDSDSDDFFDENSRQFKKILRFFKKDDTPRGQHSFRLPCE